MRFRLSTVFLLIVIFAISLGWFIDHTDRVRRRKISGIWELPTQISRMHLQPFVSTFEIRDDGTFTKTTRKEKYDGVYSLLDDGQVAFSILTRTVGSDETAASEIYFCRCAVDDSGRLTVALTGQSNPQTVFPWLEVYTRKTK